MDPGTVAGFFKTSRGDDWFQQPNRLSSEHMRWDIIDAVSRATRSPGHHPLKHEAGPYQARYRLESVFSARQAIRRRRSAQGFDRERSVWDVETFLAVLERTLALNDAPFDGFPYPPRCHLAIFVHNVKGLEPGLYFLLRQPGHEQEIRDLLDEGFAWERVRKAFPLFLLRTGHFRRQAQIISCHQEIGGESAFSLGMVVRFRPALKGRPWDYPTLFWETGLIGQIFYLEAEAHGLRGTGIGCFFDDAMHEFLGLKGDTYQSLYHFTVGFPLVDERIQTIEPYTHIKSQYDFI
jgi:nitroreductase